MRYRLFFDPNTAIIFDVPHNKGVHEALAWAGELQKAGLPLEVVNTARMTIKGLEQAYIESVVPSVYRKYRIRRIFGTNRRSGSFFGRQVPALLVTDPTHETPGDVYPHEDSSGRIVTISDFLKQFTASKARPGTQKV
jgi:hypothetical protein